MLAENSIDKIEKVNQLIQRNTQKLSIILKKTIASPTLTYNQICEIDYQGLYIIFDDTEILYIGKTNRTGKVRMQELAADFRSHTFNKKLLSMKFKELGFVFEVLKNETKKEWIEKGLLSKETFKGHQKEVNQYIKEKLKFKFYKEEGGRKLVSLEHFAISLLNPIHND